MTDQPLCEVRIPTFKRPDWLHHALESVVQQTHKNWLAIVFDDSPDQEGRSIVEAFNQPKIIYQPNPMRLGAAKNLNQAFQTSPILGGLYACVLEDDNWLMPDFITANIHALESSGRSILHRNQEVWDRNFEIPKRTEQTTLGHRLQPGVISPRELHAGIFFCTGISNGALFWRTDAEVNLQVIDEVEDSSLQEYCRCLQITVPSLFEPECKAIYAHIDPKQTHRKYIKNKRFGRALQHLWRQVIHHYGYDVIKEAEIIATRSKSREDLERRILNSLNFGIKFQYLNGLSFLFSLIKAIAKYWFVKNPIPSYQFPSRK